MRGIMLLALLASSAAACGELLGVSSDGSPEVTLDGGADDAPSSRADGEAGEPFDAFGGTDAADAADGVVETGAMKRFVFLSTTQLAGTVGRGALDQECKTNASDHGLLGNYEAFVAGMTPLAAGPAWYLPNGALVFPGDDPPTLLGSVDPKVPIVVQATGASVTGPSVVAWTGANGSDCNAWTGPDVGLLFGQVGNANSTNGTWVEQSQIACSVLAYVYCFQQ